MLFDGEQKCYLLILTHVATNLLLDVLIFTSLLWADVGGDWGRLVLVAGHASMLINHVIALLGSSYFNSSS